MSMTKRNNKLEESNLTYWLIAFFASLVVLYCWVSAIENLGMIIGKRTVKTTCVKCVNVSTTNFPKVFRTYSDGYSDRSTYFQAVSEGESVIFYIDKKGKRFLKKGALKVVLLKLISGLAFFQMAYYFYLCYREKGNYEKYHDKRMRLRKYSWFCR